MTEMVKLVIDEQAIRQKLRYAFAIHDAAVQELLQNARRAGAGQVDITYNSETLELVVQDDGACVEDFDVLMRAGASGRDPRVVVARRVAWARFLGSDLRGQARRRDQPGQTQRTYAPAGQQQQLALLDAWG